MLRTILPLSVGALAIMLVLPEDVSATDPLSLEGFDRTCLTDYLSNCLVSAAGYFTSEDGDRRFAWQTQTGFTPDDGVLGGVLLLKPQDEGWSIFGSSYQAYRYAAPLFIDDRLIHVAGQYGGSGGYNADLLYAWGDTGGATLREDWHQIDIEHWHTLIADRLPPDRAIWQGVAYDFADWEYGLVARTPLWREQDGNCCASGGDALIVFDIVTNTLVISDVIHTPPPGAQ